MNYLFARVNWRLIPVPLLCLKVMTAGLMYRLGFGLGTTMSNDGVKSDEKTELPQNVMPLYQPNEVTANPMTDRQAAALLCRHVVEGIANRRMSADENHVAVPGVYLAAACRFARRQLTDTLEDDDEKITQEWLERESFDMLSDGDGSPPYPYRTVGREELTCGVVWYNNEWQFVIEDALCDKSIMLKVVQTRGDVRKLFSVLGG